MNITTHILDTGRGKPAFGVPVRLLAQTADGWVVLGEGYTDGDGRVANLLPPTAPRAKVYRLFFDLSEYKGFYPYVEVTFAPQDERHHHVPLLLSPYGYSTYRGS